MAAHIPKEYFDTEGRLIIKPYRLKDLAAIFDINVQTLKRWMLKHPELLEHEGKYFTIHQVQHCIELFGLPQKISPVVKLASVQKAA